MNNAASKINALLHVLAARGLMVVSVDKAREIVAVMNAAAGESTRLDFHDFHGFFLDVDGVGTLRVVVPKNARRAAREGAIVAFREAAPGELAFYLDMLTETSSTTPERSETSSTTPERAALLAKLRAEIKRIEDAPVAAPAARPAPAPEARRGGELTSRQRLDLAVQIAATLRRPIALPRGRGYRSC